MNVTIIKDATPNLYQATGGGYAVTDTEVHVVQGLPAEVQQEVVIHEILEVFLPYLAHDKIDELTALLVNGISQVKETE